MSDATIKPSELAAAAPRVHPSTIVVDIDNTVTVEASSKAYSEKAVNVDVVEAIRRYRDAGFQIGLFTARGMRTYGNNVGAITAKLVPPLLHWLARHDVPFDQLFVGKPWCGPAGFYVDDRAVRPREFAEMSLDDIYARIAADSADRRGTPTQL